MTDKLYNLLQTRNARSPNRRDFVRGGMALAAGALVGLPGCGDPTMCR